MRNNVFISWSGEESHEAALALKEWLPSVIQSLEPFVSSEDIVKGARWSDDVAKNLEESGFGILCLTPENRTAPWLLFEAGALSKMVGSSQVVSLLIGLKRTELFQPLSQFQSVVTEKGDVLKLIKSLNAACGSSALEETRLTKTFGQWWPELHEKFQKIEAKIKETKDPIPEEKKVEANLDNVVKSLDELIEAFRANQNLLKSPETILPPEYLKGILEDAQGVRRHSILPEESHPVWRHIQSEVFEIHQLVHEMAPAEPEHRGRLIERAMDVSRDLSEAVDYAFRRMDLKGPRRRGGRPSSRLPSDT